MHIYFSHIYLLRGTQAHTTKRQKGEWKRERDNLLVICLQNGRLKSSDITSVLHIAVRKITVIHRQDIGKLILAALRIRSVRPEFHQRPSLPYRFKEPRIPIKDVGFNGYSRRGSCRVIDLENRRARVYVPPSSVEVRLLPCSYCPQEGLRIEAASWVGTFLVDGGNERVGETLRSAFVRELQQSNDELHPVVNLLVLECADVLPELDRSPRAFRRAVVGFPDQVPDMVRWEVKIVAVHLEKRRDELIILESPAHPHPVDLREVSAPIKDLRGIAVISEELARKPTVGVVQPRWRVNRIHLRLAQGHQLTEIAKSLDGKPPAIQIVLRMRVGDGSNMDVKAAGVVDNDVESRRQSHQHPMDFPEGVECR
jgi:hypothetical protein